MGVRMSVSSGKRMAERTQLKVAAHQIDANDDPFAELTRIMGFDPREPVRRQPEKSERPSIAGPALDDDFGIDLEKELMGELDGAEPDQRPAPSWALEDEFRQELGASAAADPQPSAKPEAELADELDEAFAEAVQSDVYRA